MIKIIKQELIDMSTSQLIDQLEARKLDFIIDATLINSDIINNRWKRYSLEREVIYEI